jgi:hypothetical protein
LEIIDLIIIIVSSIPVVGTVFDVVAFVYSFLRLEPVGMIGAAISFVPVVGDAIGGVLRVGYKFGKYIYYYRRYQQTKELVDSVTSDVEEDDEEEE